MDPGNQLPYIDKIVMTLAENLEVVNLHAMAGDIDFQARHIDLSKLPVLLENQKMGGYKVYRDPAAHGSDAGVIFNMSYEADPEIAKWFHNTDFRRALALGIDRDQLRFCSLGITSVASRRVELSHLSRGSHSWPIARRVPKPPTSS